MLYRDAVTLQFLLQLVDTVAEGFEVTHVQYLASYVEVQAYHFDVAHVGCLFDDLQHVAHVDAELVLSQSRGDVGVCMCTHVGIQAKGHTGSLALGSRQGVDDFLLGNALYVEAEDVLIQTKVDFPVRLAYAGIDYL